MGLKGGGGTWAGDGWDGAQCQFSSGLCSLLRAAEAVLQGRADSILAYHQQNVPRAKLDQVCQLRTKRCCQHMLLTADPALLTGLFSPSPWLCCGGRACQNDEGELPQGTCLGQVCCRVQGRIPTLGFSCSHLFHFSLTGTSS